MTIYAKLQAEWRETVEKMRNDDLAMKEDITDESTLMSGDSELDRMRMLAKEEEERVRKIKEEIMRKEAEVERRIEEKKKRKEEKRLEELKRKEEEKRLEELKRKEERLEKEKKRLEEERLKEEKKQEEKKKKAKIAEEKRKERFLAKLEKQEKQKERKKLLDEERARKIEDRRKRAEILKKESVEKVKKRKRGNRKSQKENKNQKYLFEPDKLVTGNEIEKIEKMQKEINEEFKKKVIKTVLRPKNENKMLVEKQKDVLELSQNKENEIPADPEKEFLQKMKENSVLIEDLFKEEAYKPKKRISINLKQKVPTKVPQEIVQAKRKQIHRIEELKRRQQENKKLMEAFEIRKNEFMVKKIQESVILRESINQSKLGNESIEEPKNISFVKVPDRIFQKAIDRKLQGSSYKKAGFNPCEYVPKTVIPAFSSKNESAFKKTFRKKEWVEKESLLKILKEQNHFEMKRYFSTCEVDIIAMFPTAKNVTNDSPNKFR